MYIATGYQKDENAIGPGNIATFVKWIKECGIDPNAPAHKINPSTTNPLVGEKIKGLEEKIQSLENSIAELNETITILKRVLRENDTDLDKLCKGFGIKRCCGE